METLDLIRTLSEATGPSGYETSIRDIVRTHWEPWSDTIRSDAMGNLIAYQRGNGPDPRPVVMAAAHMDEIALIVTGLEGNFLRIQAIGGMDRRILLGQEVTVHGKRPLPGVIGNRPPHVRPAEERGKTLPWEQIFVDVGLSEEELKQTVRIGDAVTLHSKMSELQNHLVAGKAMDNRASVASVTLALEMLHHRQHEWDFCAVATVQEEVGLKGAITSAYGVAPTLAVALDVTFGQQYNDSKHGTFSLGKGPTIGVGPNFHPQVVERLRAAAEEEEIPFQIEPTPGSSGTDAWGIQIAREGIPTVLVSIPIRYMHQPIEVVDLRDIERAARLLAAFVAHLPADYHPTWDDTPSDQEH